MFGVTEGFFDGVTRIQAQLKTPEYTQIVQKAWENARVAKTGAEAMKVFAALKNEPRFSYDEEGRTFSQSLGSLLREEENRFQVVFTKPTSQSTQEAQPPEEDDASLRQIKSVSMADVPSCIISNIVSLLSPKDERALFWTSKMPNVREGIFLNNLYNLFKLCPVSIDPECQNLYKLVFGKPLQSVPDLEIERKRAIDSGDVKKLDEVDRLLRMNVEILSNILPKEWEALPKQVRILFENIEGSEILSTQDKLKAVLQAIRGYNLIVVREEIRHDVDVPKLSTKNEFLEAAELTVKQLKEDEDTREGLVFCSRITRLPLEVTRFSKLKYLTVGSPKLMSLPAEIGNLSRLEKLGFFNVELTSLPPEIGKLTQLRKLEVHGDQLRSLPSEIGKLTQLQKLDLDSSQLRSLPPEIGKITQLRKLWLRCDQLRSLPPEIGYLTQLRKLWLCGSQFRSLPPEIGNLIRLEELEFSSPLASVPPEIGKLTQLRKLLGHDAQFRLLPPEIGKLTQLRNLCLDNGQLEALPSEIGKLTQLRKLWLLGNQLRSLPPEIGNLTQLKCLGLDHNQLLALPSETRKLGALTALHMSGNPLSEGEITKIRDIFQGRDVHIFI